MGFMDDGVMFVLRRGEERAGTHSHSMMNSAYSTNVRVQTFAYKLRFEGANLVQPIGRDRLAFKSNFFVGNDSDRWRTDVPNFRAVLYPNLYDGIDLSYRPWLDGVKYEFVVHPGADPKVIQLSLEGVDSIQLDGAGIAVDTPLGRVWDLLPRSYDDTGREVACVLAIRGSNAYGIDCSGWSRDRILTIDPIVYATFLGGSDRADDAWGIAVDRGGNACVVGGTGSIDFPATPGAFSVDLNGSEDAYVVRLGAAGDMLLYATYLGGSEVDRAISVAVNFSGECVLTGSTESPDYPTYRAIQQTLKGTDDAFVSMLNASGDGLIFSTYLGGMSSDEGMSITIDSSNKIYILGATNSSDFPVTPDAFQTHIGGGSDMFVSKIVPSIPTLEYSTFLGGSGDESWAGEGGAIWVDGNGNMYATSVTSSADFPVPGGMDTTLGGTMDAFFVKSNDTGSLVYGTYLGGSARDQGFGLALDSSGNAYVVGTTESANFPIAVNALGGSAMDGFIAKIDTTGALVFSRYLGGTFVDGALSVAVDATGVSHVVGFTMSTDFPVTNDAIDRTLNGSGDAFVASVSPTGSLLFASYLGGSALDSCGSITLDGAGNLYLAGATSSPDFPVTPGAFDTIYNGGSDAFIMKLNSSIPTPLPDLELGPPDITFNPLSPVETGNPITVSADVHNLGDADASSVLVRFFDGPPSMSNQIGPDRVIPFIPHGGAFPTSIVWTAEPPGVHLICAVADPASTILELNESNNQACDQIEVITPPIPDLSVSPSDVGFSPPSPFTEGSAVEINATIHNVGGNASEPTATRFYDGLPPSFQIGADQPLPPIQAGGAENVTVAWIASPPGSHEICVVADPDNVVAEINETNNMACVSVFVQSLPITKPDYVPFLPLPQPPIKTGLSKPVSLSVVVHNQGNATDSNGSTLAFYDESAPAIPFATFSVSPVLAGGNSSRFTATWMSPATPGTYLVSADVDYWNNVTEWNETNNVYTWTIDVVTGPITSLVIGIPSHTSPASVMYVRSSTPLDLSVIDQSGTGINHTRYRIDNVTWIEYSSSFFLSGDGDHYVEWYSEDNVGNIEVVSWRVMRIDDIPPASAISIGEPKYLTGGSFVNSSTPLVLSAVDGGVGSNSTFYRLWDGSWSQWRDYSSSFSLAGRDGTWYVEFLSFDYLGNVESIRNETLILDDTPPVTMISPAAPFTLTATDAGCGVNVTRYRIDGGSWIVYTGGFTLAEGEHTIYYYSIDNLGNVEQERSLTVRPTTEVAVNYKPMVALVFAVILLVAGVWSSKRRPWKGGKDTMAVAKAFMFTSLPFSIAEAGTGIVSLLTGQLSMPPIIGLGTGVDLTILLGGLLFLTLRSLRKDSPIDV